jgi:hypothetical protein
LWDPSHPFKAFSWKEEENKYSIERKRHYAWSALGWVTAWEHELQMGFLVHSVALERAGYTTF